MSHQIFKPSAQMGKQQDGARYKPVSPTYDPALIKKLLSHCYPGNPRPGISLSDEFAPLITTHAQEDFDPRQFLDAVVAEASTARGLSSSSYLDDFLTPVVQALYNLGYNSFELDLSFCDTGNSAVTLATGLRGKPGKLLEVTYKGISPYEVSNCNEFCKVTLDGAAESVGSGSGWSEFTVTGRVPLHTLGDAGSYCVFRLAEPDPCELMFCDYIDPVTEDDYEPVLSYLENEGFFTRGNELYFPDGQGRWKEVGQ